MLRGDAGDDLLQGKTGRDRLDGGRGDDTLFGGAGPDELRGGPGKDGLGGGLGPDELFGGRGRDIAFYGQRGRPVRVTIGRGANDGTVGEGDNVHGDVEDIRGGDGSDVLIGNGRSNRLFGEGGRDRLVGRGGSDVLIAGGGSDRIDAREAAAAARGDARAAADPVDRVTCGGGEDTALVDPSDDVDPDCEHVFGGATSPPSPPPVNHPPTGIALAPTSVAENRPVGTVVGTLSAGDPDPGDTHSFALVPGAGSTDNGSFQIVGSTLRTAAVFNYEVKHTYSVRIRATDHGTPAGQIVRAFTITVTNVNERPTITTSAGALAYVEDAAAAAVDGNLTVGDADDANLVGARVRVSSGFDVGDVLLFTDQNGITGAYDAATGVLTLTGTSSVANYQTALRSVQYRHTGDDPGTSKTVEFRAEDGGGLGPPATRAIAVTPVNDAPVVVASAGSASFTEGGGPVLVDLGLAVTDPDSATLTGATVTLTAPLAEDTLGFTNQNGITGSYSSGVLTLLGMATVATYQAALRSVTYSNSSPDPSTTDRTVSFQVTDAGGLPSNADTRTVTVAAANDPPTVTMSGGAVDYTEGAAATTVDTGLTVSDPDDANLVGATVRVSAGFDVGDELPFTNQNGINGAYDANTGVLTLTGSSSVANYQAALRSVQFRTTNDNPATTKTVEFVVNDGTTTSTPETRDIKVTRVNDAPTLDTTNASLAYPEGAGPVAADPGITVTDPDSTQIQGASVQITSNFVSAQDELAFTDQLGITGSYDDTTGTLTLTGTTSVANYQAALRAVIYENSSQNPSPAGRTLTFQATDAEGATSAPATRDITLGAANDAATITTTPTPLAYTEGDAATAIDDGLTVSDPDDTNLEGATVRISAGFNTGDELLFTDQNGITGSYNAGTGLLTLTGTSSLANYQSALRSVQFRTTNDDPATVKTVEFRADDGDGLGPGSTRNIDVTRVDDPPSAVNDSPTVAEDSDANAIDVLTNDTDPDGGPMTIASTSDPANGTVLVTGGGSGLTYQPDTNYCNSPPGTTPDTFTYTLNGGSTATVSVTVTCVDDPPTAVNDSPTVAEDSGANAIDVLTNDTDIDAGPKTIASASDPANGTVAVTGGGSGLTYQPDTNYCNSPPGTTPDTFTYTLNGGSTATVSVTVTCVDDPPTAVNNTATVGEDSGANAIDVLTNDTDPDGGAKTITSASDPANGTVVLTGGAPATGLTYQPDPNYCNDPPGTTPDTFTYTLTGGSTATVPVTVTCAPDNPVVDTSAGTTSYTENAAATVIDAAVTVSDPDAGTTITGATVKISGAGTEDVLALAGTHPGITAVFAGDTLTLTGDATPAAYQSALRDVTYRNSSDNPSTAPRTVTFTVTDATSRSGSDTKGITVTAVDDPPTAVNDSATVLEDAAATAVDVLSNDTDVDAGPKTISSASAPANGTVVLTGGSPGARTGLTYQPNPNYCNNPPGTAPDTFTYTINGGSTATVSMTVTCVNDTPVADDETFDGTNAAIGNTSLVVNDPDDGAPALTSPKKSITGDILAGDTDIDSPGPLTIVAGTFATADGGSVTIQADGDFIYTPKAATSCTDHSDSFNYTVSDGNATGPGPTPGTDTGTVTIAINGCVWYVDNTAAAGNGGTSVAPFNTLAAAETASSANETVFVFDGNTSTGYGGDGYAMNAGERLIGEHTGLTVDPDGSGPLGTDTLHPANPGAKPTLTATNADVITLNSGNEVRGFVIDPSGAGFGGIAGGAAATSGATIADVDITDTGTAGTDPGLELNGSTGTFNVSNFTVTTTAGAAVNLNNAGTVNLTAAGTISLSSAGGPALTVANTALSGTVDSTTTTSSPTTGISLTTTTGSLTLDDINLTTTGTALALNNANNVTVNNSGDADISTTGTAVNLTNGPTAQPGAPDVALDQVSSSGGTVGINIDGIGAGTFSAAGGTLSGHTSAELDINGGSGNITYPGTIGNGSGLSAQITGRSAGTVALAGNINDTNDAGGGIDMSTNTGGTFNFSGTTKKLDTGAGAAFSSTGSSATINFTGGGLDIDTTTGAGFAATGGGTVTVTTGATPNTIDAVSATALNVANTTIGANGLTFQSISSGNNTAAADPANGIVLNNTGATVGLTVTGTGNTTQGGNASGGTIQNTTGFGVSLTNTTAPSLRNMSIQNTGDSGINGTQVSGFSFTDGTINGAGDASDENSITFDDNLSSTPNLTGAVTITNNVISQTEAEGVDIENWAGTISDANISNNALSDTGDVATPGSAVTLIDSGLAASAANLTKATVANNTITDFRAGVGVQVRAGNPAAGGPTSSAGTAGSATNIINVTGNSMNGGNGGVGNQPDRFFTGGVSGNGGQGNFNISNNGTAASRLRSIDCIAIEVQMDGPVTMTSTVNNNFINANSAVGCAGIAVGTDDPNNLGAGSHSTVISNNNVMGTDGPGIFPIVRASASTMFARVLNNTVAAPITTNAARAGIRVDSGSSAGDTTMCLEISGNTTAGSTNTATATTSPGINLRKQGTDPTINTFGIEGMNATSSPGVENYVNGLNTSTSGTFGTGGTALLSATAGFTNCTAP